jgi:hypothetical protein
MQVGTFMFHQMMNPPHYIIIVERKRGFYIVEGNFSFIDGDEETMATDEVFVYTRRGEFHTYRNLPNRPGKESRMAIKMRSILSHVLEPLLSVLPIYLTISQFVPDGIYSHYMISVTSTDFSWRKE